MSCKCYGNSNTKILPVISMEMKERIREKLCNECQTILVQLPSDKSWGLIIGDAGKGMLYVVKVKEKSEALKAGIEEGDYIYKFIDENVDILHSPNSFVQYVEEIKSEMKNRQKLQMKLKRKKMYRT
jgi:C-terminal processing protease CtpA/Prc